MKCKCPPGSAFHWREDPRPSIFMSDPKFNQNAKLSHSQSAVVDREREQGRDIGHLPGLSKHERLLQAKRFTIYSRA